MVPMFSILCLLSLGLLSSLIHADTQACTKSDACSCTLNGSVLSLRTLAKSDGTAVLKVLGTHGGQYDFYFNPCLTFTEGGCGGGDVAVCQSVNEQAASGNYSCGVQSSAQFVFRDGDNSNVYLKFKGGDLDRTSYIKLICSNGTKSSLNFVSEEPVTVYNLELTSPCACPGAKDCNMLPKTTCVQEDQCSCHMSDGSGTIHLGALSSPKSPLEYKSSNLKQFYYNPCHGFSMTGHASINQCHDVSVCERNNIGLATEEFLDLGRPNNPKFETDEGNVVSLVYTGSGGRRSTVHLICDREAREFPVFNLEKASGRNYTFSMRSVCACPGGCVTPPRRCNQIDSCTCDYDDGSGTVSLHYLDNPFAPLITKTFQGTITIYTYLYNPCSGVKTSGSCYNVSACQQVNQTFAGSSQTFRLGGVQPALFTTSENGRLALRYSGGDPTLAGDPRTFHVELECDHDALVPVLGNATETNVGHYSFSLRSKCACPDGCPNK